MMNEIKAVATFAGRLTHEACEIRLGYTFEGETAKEHLVTVCCCRSTLTVVSGTGDSHEQALRNCATALLGLIRAEETKRGEDAAAAQAVHRAAIAFVGEAEAGLLSALTLT